MKQFVCLYMGLLLLLPSSLFAATVKLTWIDNSTGGQQEDGVIIQRTVNASEWDWVEVGRVGQGMTEFSEEHSGGSLCYRVAAFNTAGTSPFSNAACVVIPGVPNTPGVPTVSFTITFTMPAE